jgi:chromosome segregation ATPase
LKHFAKVADTLISDQASRNLTSSTRLEEALRNAAAALNHTDASYSELRSSTEQLSLAVRSALEDVDELEAPVRSRLERLVLDAMDERLQIDRCWLLPLGFDPLPHTVAPIEAALS